MDPYKEHLTKCCYEFRDNFVCKPFYVFVDTFYNWHVTKFCLSMYVILLFVVCYNFNITVNQDNIDVNNNVASRNALWHVMNLNASLILSFYAYEWIMYDKESRYAQVLSATGAIRSTRDDENPDIVLDSSSDDNKEEL